MTGWKPVVLTVILRDRIYNTIYYTKYSLRNQFLVTKVRFLLSIFDENYQPNIWYKDIQNIIDNNNDINEEEKILDYHSGLDDLNSQNLSINTATSDWNTLDNNQQNVISNQSIWIDLSGHEINNPENQINN